MSVLIIIDLILQMDAESFFNCTPPVCVDENRIKNVYSSKSSSELGEWGLSIKVFFTCPPPSSLKDLEIFASRILFSSP